MIGDFMGSDVTLIDSGKVTAQAAAAALADLGLLNGRAEGGNAHYYVSDTPDNFDELEHRFLGEYAGGPVEQIAIETTKATPHNSRLTLNRSGGCGTASALPKCSIRHPVLSALLA